MRIFNKFRGTKGFIIIGERVLRFRYMITEQAQERVRVLESLSLPNEVIPYL